MALKNLALVVWIITMEIVYSTQPVKKEDNTRSTRINLFGKKISRSTITYEFEFPEELELDFSITGEATMRTKSRRVSSLRDMATFDSRGRKHSRHRKNQQFYVDDNGSYQVSAALGVSGTVETDVKAAYRNGNGEKCFYARGESHCWNIQGERQLGNIPFEGRYFDHLKTKSTITDRRKKRHAGPLIYSDFDVSRVLKVVYVADKPMMEWFRSLSDDDETAIQDAEDYFMMLNNEITYTYRGIKEVSERNIFIPNMDIVVYAQGFYYPEFGTDLDWVSPYLRNNGTGILTTSFVDNDDAMAAFGEWVEEGNLDQFGAFDHAAYITTRDILSSDEINRYGGFAFTATVCDPSKVSLKVSIMYDGSVDIARTAAHEIGHALSSAHDTDTGLFARCPTETYIMSARTFFITEQTKDTWNRWSVCSVRSIVDHVRSLSGCLQDSGVSNDDFYDQLCGGVRASNQFDVDFQCKIGLQNRDKSSVACGPNVTVSTGKVPAQACWDDFMISCTDSQGNCSDEVFTVFDGTPCIGADENRDYVCYRGDCLEKVDVCVGRNTARCDCSSFRGFRRIRCCRKSRKDDGSCCNGCRRTIWGGCRIALFY